MNWLTVTVFVLAWFSIMAIVLCCWRVRVNGFRNARAASVRLARFRTADEAWSDRELRKAEYQLALRLAVGEGDAEAGRVRLEAVAG